MRKRLEVVIVYALVFSILIFAAPTMEVDASPEGLVYDSSYNTHSTTAVTTTSVSLVDDAQASITFTLTETKVVLVIYSACNYYGVTDNLGKKLGISIDSSDVATVQSSPGASFYPNGGVVIWVGTLVSGSHTIIGRFASFTAGQIGTISERRLVAVVFSGGTADFMFIRSTNAVTTSSTSLVDDAEAKFTFTSPSCKALILYSTCNYQSTTEIPPGKRIAVSTDGSDGLALGASPHDFNSADSEFVAEIRSLGSGSHTIKGRFASNYAGTTVTISERQFAILLFPSSLETDFVESSSQVSVTGSTLSDDTQASVQRTISGTRYVLAIYCAGKRGQTTSSSFGEKVAVVINTTGYTLNAQSPYSAQYANTAAIQSNVTELGAGTHIVKGRFACNRADDTAKVDDRQLCVLWFLKAQPVPVGGFVLLADEVSLLTPYAVMLIVVVAAVSAVGAKAAKKRHA